MAMPFFIPLLLFLVTVGAVDANDSDYFPPASHGLKVVESTHHEGVKISYKEPGICETTPGVRSYSGYVYLPPGTLDDFNLSQPYPINTFFWFFEARNSPEAAPLAVWLNGGPGASSLMGLMQENGPCRVNSDSNSTELNPWSWNNNVNMIYIDQPVQVGFSYDTLTNGTLNQLTQSWDMSPFTDGVPESNNTFRVGTFPTMDSSRTANTTENAARALWHFLQAWLTEFPEYSPDDGRISLWTESYGGHYGPAFASFFQRQNEISRMNPCKGDTAYDIHLETLGIINGCIDQLVQTPAFAEMGHANTYGIEVFNETISDLALHNYYMPGGCKDQVHYCRHLAAVGDPNMYGDNSTVNDACFKANTFCRGQVESVYYNYSTLSPTDISHQYPDPFPPPFYIGYLNQRWVQSALGVPLNFSFATESSFGAFQPTGDYSRGDTRGYIGDIGYLLDSGVKVALVYGDRDYICNWYGGEAVSLQIPYEKAPGFRAAGYADIHTNNSYIGGFVRQHDNFSFTRVFQSGHQVPAYQPETAYRVFQRVMFNRDVATGNFSTAKGYTSQGLGFTWDVTEKPPASPPPLCYVLDLVDTCTPEQILEVVDGTAVVKDFVVQDK